MQFPKDKEGKRWPRLHTEWTHDRTQKDEERGHDPSREGGFSQEICDFCQGLVQLSDARAGRYVSLGTYTRRGLYPNLVIEDVTTLHFLFSWYSLSLL